MITQLRTECLTGAIDDLAHVVSIDCMADALTKASANPAYLLKAVNTGKIPNVDKHPPFRELMKGRHKAYCTIEEWLARNLPNADQISTFLCQPVHRRILLDRRVSDLYDRDS